MYQTMSNYPQITNPYAIQQNQDHINWVQGIEGAKAWQMQPNKNTVLMDSENDGIFYIKSCDQVGMCNLRVFKYEEITNTMKQQSVQPMDLSEYVKKSELESLIKSMIGGKSNEPVVSTDESGKSKKLITK